MTRRRYTDLLCVVIAAVMVAATLLFAFGEALGLSEAHLDPPYASSLFSTDTVHTLDIVVDESDWSDMLANASSKEYILAHVVIDGNSVKNVGIRTKGNSSLSSIAMSDTDRYSFKIEFDHYDGTQSYQGLDKLALNNIAQDNTYLKDYISYRMMVAFGADAPLCSFIYITVNGEEWGLYLAVEGIEEAFAERSYGSDYGQLYKPDNMNMVGNRDDAGGGMQMPDFADMAEGDFSQMFGEGGFPDFENGFPGMNGELPEGFGETLPEGESGDENAVPNRGGFGGMQGDFGNIGNGGFGGFGGSSDIALQYTDDEHDSYSSIFNSAKFDPIDADKDRLIASIKQLNEGENLEEVVNIDEVLRYFVVHNFVLNFDSYTGSMLHNYYLYEDDGVLSMIAWDYNLSFGAMSMGGGVNSATDLANYPIDTPVSGTNMEDRPLLNQLLSDETYLEMYHELFDEFIADYFENGGFAEMYDNAVRLISPYVERDPTAFCTYDEFVSASDALREFCLLRAESVRGQLDGTISSTSVGQSESGGAGFVDASHIDMDAMGSNSMGFGRARNNTDSWQTRSAAEQTPAFGTAMAAGIVAAVVPVDTSDLSETIPPGGDSQRRNPREFPGGESLEPPDGDSLPDGASFPDGFEMPEDFTPPDGFEMPEDGVVPPEGAAEILPETETPENSQPEDSGMENPIIEGNNRGQNNFGADGNMAGWGGEVQTTENSAQPYWLLGGTLVLMAGGLVFAVRFKRW